MKIDGIVTIVKLRLGDVPESLDGLIFSYAQEIESRIKNYCQISVVPEGLYYVWVAMVIDILRVEQPAKEGIGDAVDTGGDNIKIGDTSVSKGRARKSLRYPNPLLMPLLLTTKWI
ncbi:hypothetical protein HMSSN036_52160 [Paenibacillus macerans]|nr:hypothetical protein HMSSN036_52160 [Paenibacillus macerans]